VRFIGRTPVRTFVVYPMVILAWELIIHRGSLALNLWCLPVMLWGYLQYRLCGLYRIKHGGGGPGLEIPPERLVVTGPYALSRNPMYLGHIIFLTGLALTVASWLAALITVSVAVWFHSRVLGDEKKLIERLGEPYKQYLASVKRWIPGLF
jgi:protein-S-isoprenylcysteine O-methyltransferase Ste14